MSKKNLKKPVIVVAHASTGSGHRRAAEAIAENLVSRNYDAEVHVVDILDYFIKKIDGDKVVGLTAGPLSPLFCYTWRHNFTGRVLWAGGKMWPSIIYKEFQELIKSLKPDCVICTHFVCANSAAKARMNMDKKFAIISVPTDYETEGLWPHKETDLFCVASQKMKETLLQREVPEENIQVTGIPVSKSFNKNYSKDTSISKFNMDKNKVNVLIIAGASESGPYLHMRSVIEKCIPYFVNMEWVDFTICVGNDEDYKNKIDYFVNEQKGDNIKVFTFTKDLPRLMRACDIAMVKPGGLAVTECLNSRLPMILIGKAYAQERVNAEFLTAEKAAVWARDYEEIIHELCLITSEVKRYNDLNTNINRIRQKNSAKKIADRCIDFAKHESRHKEHKHTSIYFVR